MRALAHGAGFVASRVELAVVASLRIWSSYPGICFAQKSTVWYDLPPLLGGLFAYDLERSTHGLPQV